MDAVFNYDVPDEQEYYTHRIGRTGRAKKPRRRLHFCRLRHRSASSMDEIVRRHQKAEMQLLKYDKDGCLMIQ